MGLFSTGASNEAENQAWLANLKATRPDAYAAYMRYLQLNTARQNDPMEGGSATRTGRRRAREQMGYSEQAFQEARQNLLTNYPEVMQYASTHGQYTGGLGQGGDALVAAIALPVAASYAAGAGAGAGAGTGTNAALPSTGMVGTGELSAAEAAQWGVGAGAGTGGGVGTTSAGGGLWSSLAGQNGSNIPSWIGLAGNLWAANRGGGNPGAAADPFASQRPMYQEMLRNLMTDPSSFQDTPMFQTALDTGTEAVNRGAGAKGTLNSGARLAELEKFGVGLSNQNFFDYLTSLGTLSGATSGSPGAAAQINYESGQARTGNYLDALANLTQLGMTFSGYGS